MEVTAANRKEYVDLYASWVLTQSISKQFESFKVLVRFWLGVSLSLSLSLALSLSLSRSFSPSLCA
jgi:hypothetical protein